MRPFQGEDSLFFIQAGHPGVWPQVRSKVSIGQVGTAETSDRWVDVHGKVISQRPPNGYPKFKVFKTNCRIGLLATVVRNCLVVLVEYG